MKRTLIRAAVFAALAFTAVALPGAARAAPPGNDNFAAATVIDPSTLPFSDSVDVSEATTENGEPGGGCFFSGQTVWYTITPSTNAVYRVDTTGSTYNNSVNIYAGTSINALSFAGCGYSFQSPTFRATAGTTYYIQIGAYFSVGQLDVSVSQVPAPPNDAFADATTVDPLALPFSDSQTGLAATLEAGEPAPSCSVFGNSPDSWWYTFTPTTTRSYTISGFSGSVPTEAVYTGDALGSLTEIACRSGGSNNALSFVGTAGATYHIRVSDAYQGAFGGTSITLGLAPDPVAAFGCGLLNPSSFDTVQFCDGSSDPGGNGFSTETWNFGDGTILTNPGTFPTHRWVKDGDYNLTLTVTTTDGRTGKTTQVIHVRTHDVAIGSFALPGKGRVGRTSQVIVGISNFRYPETVQVQLFASTASGFQLVGTSTQSVPVTGHKKTVPFTFNYTFTAADASVGKVTFEAVATIAGAPDALPSDNTAISLPVPVIT